MRIIILCFCLLAGAANAQNLGTILEQGKGLLQSSGLGKSSSGDGDLVSGLKEALKVGSERVISRVGKNDGYMADPKIHIPLPDALAKTNKALGAIGGVSLLNDLELKMNRAAEAAAPKAIDIFGTAITQMRLEDAQKIFSGPNDAATQYFKKTTTQPLVQAFRPIVDQTLAQAGAVQAFNGALAQNPMLSGLAGNFDLTGFVTEKALAGMFHYLAGEEEAIRTNPTARTTELLQKVFGKK